MDKQDKRYGGYIAILKEELVPAMGCTEPAAIAFAAARARAELGVLPSRVEVQVSGNIVKNVRSVVVPHTGGLRGIKAATAAGIAAGDANKKLEVIASVTPSQQEEIKTYLEKTPIDITMTKGDRVFEIIVAVYSGAKSAKVRITDAHTNITLIEKDGKIIFEAPNCTGGTDAACQPCGEFAKGKLYKQNPQGGGFCGTDAAGQPCGEFAEGKLYKQNPQGGGFCGTDGETSREFLDVEGAIDFAETVQIEDVRPIIERQIEYNTAISKEGLKNNWGANIGKVLLAACGPGRPDCGEGLQLRARAAAAAGSDARMSGCEMPVIILSGSGNQGMTASLPVIEYAGALGVSRETLIRALVLSSLVTVHLKSGIGRLSAYCGVVSAGAAAGAGIAFLHGGRLDAISHTIVNAIAITSGIVCDGAKPSCAAKISAAVDAGIIGWTMFKNGQQFCRGEGLVSSCLEKTIDNISRLGKVGMQNTDKEIINIMLDDDSSLCDSPSNGVDRL